MSSITDAFRDVYRRHPRWTIGFSAVAGFFILILALVIMVAELPGGHSTANSAADAPIAPSTIESAPAATPLATATTTTPLSGSPSSPESASAITTPDFAAATAILSGSVQHYANELHQGEAILGSAPYPDAMTGLAAMNDPSSAAARFRDYQQDPNPAADNSLEKAFEQADAYFNADNEPPSISTWRDDMIQLSGDLASFVQTGVSWQISEVGQAQLTAAEQKVEADIVVARHDVDAVGAGR